MLKLVAGQVRSHDLHAVMAQSRTIVTGTAGTMSPLRFSVSITSVRNDTGRYIFYLTI